MLFLLVFGASALGSLLLTPLVGRLGRRWGLVDHPGGRRRHAVPTPRLGGIALFLSFFTVTAIIYWVEFVLQEPAVLEDARRLRGVLLGTVFVFIVGLIDDRYDLKPAPQYIAQFIAALIAIIHTVFIQEVTTPWSANHNGYPTGSLLVLPCFG